MSSTSSPTRRHEARAAARRTRTSTICCRTSDRAFVRSGSGTGLGWLARDVGSEAISVPFQHERSSSLECRTATSPAGRRDYERLSCPAIATPVSAALLEEAALRPGERVLDVACGTGLIARLAAERVGPAGTVTGVDLSPDMVRVARTAVAVRHRLARG